MYNRYNPQQRNSSSQNQMQLNTGRQYNGNYQNTAGSYNERSGSFEDNPKLQGVDPLKLKIILEIKNKSKNKSIEELLPEIMKINQELNRRNMNFTKNESELLLEAIEESLSPADKQKFNMLKSFMQ